jgi:hypothetical protein
LHSIRAHSGDDGEWRDDRKETFVLLGRSGFVSKRERPTN